MDRDPLEDDSDLVGPLADVRQWAAHYDVHGEVVIEDPSPELLEILGFPSDVFD